MSEMHPRILERRRAVAEAGLSYLPPEEWEKEKARWIAKWESRLPRPGNYPKKTVADLRRVLAEIDRNLELLAAEGSGDLVEAATEMYRRHRACVIRELARRGKI